MKQINLEFSLEQTLSILEDKKKSILAQNSGNESENLDILDKLIEKTYALMEEETLEDKVLLGSFVNLGVWNNQKDSKDFDIYLGFATTDKAINIFSPFGVALYGSTLGSIVSYQDEKNSYDVVVFNKNVRLEKDSSKLKKVNYAYLASSKKNN